MSKTVTRARRKPKSSRTKAALIPGTLWGLSCLLIVLAAGLAALRLVAPAQAWISAAAFGLLALSALSLLAMLMYTLPREDAYDWEADFSALPAVAHWPLQLGTWAGQLVVLLVMLWIALTSSGSTPSGGARFAMSVLAVLGALVTLTTVQPAPVIIALLAVWGAVIVVALLRGIYGFVAGLVR